MALTETEIRQVLDRIVAEIEKNGWLERVNCECRTGEEEDVTWLVKFSTHLKGVEVTCDAEIGECGKINFKDVAIVTSPYLLLQEANVKYIARIVTVILVASYFLTILAGSIKGPTLISVNHDEKFPSATAVVRDITTRDGALGVKAAIEGGELVVGVGFTREYTARRVFKGTFEEADLAVKALLLEWLT